jgi:hypothetical protein
LLLPSPVNKNERTVYVAFGGRFAEQSFNYHGWLMAYDAKTLAPRGVFCSTPDRQADDNGGGIWQGGGGLAGDENGNVYFNTGNGPASGNDHGNSIVRLTSVLRAGKYDFDVLAFSAEADDPTHMDAWENKDVDLGAGGVTLIPGSTLLVSGGKTGVLYLLDRSTMKKILSFDAFSVNPANDSDPVGARFRDWGSGPHLHGAWTYWAVSPARGYIYHWAEKDLLRRFDYDPTTGKIDPASVVTGDVLAKPFPVMPAGLISLSANGTQNGVLWVTLPWDGPGRIMAFDATTLRRVWDTTVPPGTYTSHNGPPTVANGRVIVGTQNASFLVYALTSPPAPAAPRTSHAVSSPHTAMVAAPVAPAQATLPIAADSSPWVSEYLRRLAPDRAAAITPPKGHRALFLATTGQASLRYCSQAGSLTYEARSPGTANPPQWVLVAISGALCDDTGVMPHMAYRGLGQTLATAQPALAWKIADGGEVVHWSVKASANPPQSADAPWVLFSSESSGGHSLLDQVTYVQLLGTVGGAPPAAVGQLGERVQVPYAGRYVFYVPEAGGPTPSH